MTSTVLLMVAAVLAVIDWWAVWMRKPTVERLAKPATMAALVAVASVAGDVSGDVRLWLVVGALFGLIGDVALLGAGEAAFMAGLGAFAVGHLAYVVAALFVGFDAAWAIPGVAFMVALLGYRFAAQTVPGARREGGPVLAGAVVFYAVVISTMVVTSWATAVWLAAAGAMLFALSDWVLGYQRFVRPLPGRGVSVIVPYHLGQALLIIGLATS